MATQKSQLARWLGLGKVAVLLIGLLILAAPFLNASTAQAVDGEVRLVAWLNGAEEVPGPGDPDGVGRARVTLMPDNEMCYFIRVAHIQLPAAAAHIHVGARGVAGPVVQALSAPNADGFAHACIRIDGHLWQNLRNNPSAYYVNVHNAPYPGGAVRGQLDYQ